MTRKRLSIALAGNPNSGKTTLFNNLTGARQHVGNYAGVTVEKKEGFRNYKNYELTIVDLPGTYSLTAYSPEEVVARNFVVRETPDVVVDIVDASNFERNLYLATQLLELERPMVLALNMADVAETRGIRIDDQLLAKRLGIPVVRTVGSRKQGMEELLETVVSTAHKTEKTAFAIDYGRDIEEAIGNLVPLLASAQAKLNFPRRWLALKLLEHDQDIIESIKKLPGGEDVARTAAAARSALQQKMGDDPELLIANFRYRFLGTLYREIVTVRDEDALTLSDKIDRVLTNRVLGLPIFLGLMWLVFNLVFTVGAYPQEWIEKGVQLLGGWVGQSMAEGDLKSLVADGVIGGVGGVIVFLPQVVLLFFAISLLEGTGYMARAAFIMDRVMYKVGLHGKSFIPLLLGFGCSVPAIMGARTLENPRDRLVTILVTPLMSCSARLPVYTVLIAAFFGEQLAGNVLFSIYLLGIVLAIVMARVFRSVLFTGSTEPFVMELPPYRIPTLKSTLFHMWERSILYLQKAGTIILAVSVIIWFLTNYPSEVPYSKDYAGLLVQAETMQQTDIKEQLGREQAAEKLGQSYAGQVGRFIEPAIAPLGFDWKMGVGLFAAFTAKEVLVSTLGTIYSVGADDGSAASLKDALAADPAYNPLVAYALMVFVLIYSPCLATIATIKRETNSWKWALFSSGYSTALAWVIAFAVYQGGKILGLGG